MLLWCHLCWDHKWLVWFLGPMSNLWDADTRPCLWFWLGVRSPHRWDFMTSRTQCHQVCWQGRTLLSWGSRSCFLLDDHKSWWRRWNGPSHRSFAQGFWWMTAFSLSGLVRSYSWGISCRDYHAPMQDINKRGSVLTVALVLLSSWCTR